jgi:siroheme synthase (precorrin-2 oxidase/ferrochelatase)
MENPKLAAAIRERIVNAFPPSERPYLRYIMNSIQDDEVISVDQALRWDA